MKIVYFPPNVDPPLGLGNYARYIRQLRREERKEMADTYRRLRRENRAMAGLLFKRLQDCRRRMDAWMWDKLG